MKFYNKYLSLLLVFIMALSLTDGITVKAANSSITVTLRVEQDEVTAVTPVTVTLTDADKRDFGIGLSTSTLTPLHALAKYMATKKGVTDKTMPNYIKVSKSEYGLFLTGISTDGASSGAPAADAQDGVTWMYNVNNTVTTVGVSSCRLKDKDSLVFYGLWGGGIWPDSAETYFSYFDRTSYSAYRDIAFTVSLKGIGWSNAVNLAGASVIAAEYKDHAGAATEKNAVLTAKTDKNGNASLRFTETGFYVLSACRKTADGSHYDISRPYAFVEVKRVPPCYGMTYEKPKPKPSKPTHLRAKVKKTKKKKKTVELSWYKCHNAKSYRVYISKKKRKGYRKLADTKKAKLTFKKKTGTYYVKIKAFGYYSENSKFSNPLKIKIKKQK